MMFNSLNEHPLFLLKGHLNGSSKLSASTSSFVDAYLGYGGSVSKSASKLVKHYNKSNDNLVALKPILKKTTTTTPPVVSKPSALVDATLSKVKTVTDVNNNQQQQQQNCNESKAEADTLSSALKSDFAAINGNGINSDKDTLPLTTVVESKLFQQKQNVKLSSSKSSMVSLLSNALDADRCLTAGTATITAFADDELSISGTASQPKRTLQQQSLSIDGYLIPVSASDTSTLAAADTDQPTFPFPMPCDALIRSRTDLGEIPTSDQSPLGPPTHLAPTLPLMVQSPHGYVNAASCDYLMDETTYERKRELLADLIAKEREYLVLMTIVHEEYFSTLARQSDVARLILNARDRDTLFGALNRLYEFHARTLLPELEARQAQWCEDSLSASTQRIVVCDLFAQHAEQIRCLYSELIDSFRDTLQCLDKVLLNDAQLARLVHHISTKCDVKYGAVVGAMRIEHPSAPLSLRTLLTHAQVWPCEANRFLLALENFIGADHAEFAYFINVIDQFNDLATKAVNAMDDAKKEELMRNLQRRLGGKFNVLDRKRVLVKEGPLVTVSPLLGSVIRVYVVLLSDQLIICDQADNELEPLKPRRPLDVLGMSVSNDAVNAFGGTTFNSSGAASSSTISAEFGVAINVPAIQRVFKFYARNAQEKAKWFAAFRTVALANKFHAEIDRSNVGKIPPKFIPEKLAAYCFRCKCEFSAINRKHHCKACGYIFCHKCSKATANLAYDVTKKSRVCDLCYDQIFNTFRAMPPSAEQISRRIRQV